MTPLVSREHVQPRGQAEANATYERINETHAGKIQVSVLMQEGLQFMMRRDELVESISKGRRLTRDNFLWRLCLEWRFHRRLHVIYKPPSD